MTPTITPSRSIEVESGASGGYDLVDLLLPILQSKRLIALWTLLGLLCGAFVALIAPPYYIATSIIMPPQQQQSVAGALAGQLGSLSGLGAANGMSLKNPGDIYVGILESRVIADSLIDRFNLQAAYRVSSRTEARKALRAKTEVEAAKDGLIYLRVRDSRPKLAAEIANGFVEALHEMNSRLAIGEAAQRRLFFDQRLNEEKRALTVAEDELKGTEEKTGIIQLNGQAEVTIQNIARARADIASREVELGVMRTFATEQNPDVARQQQEIAARRAQLRLLEEDERHASPGDVQVAAGRVPSAGLEYLRKLREVRYHESLYELLAKQQVAASLDEAKSAPLIQVVDPAEAPEQRSGPSRLLIFAGFGTAGFLLAVAATAIRTLIHSLMNQPGQASRLKELRDALRLTTVSRTGSS